MLSAYRELKSGEKDTTELDEHLQTCASCREALASYTAIGEQMRATTVCPSTPDFRARLMRALADEQIQQIHQSPPGTVSTPEFLKPYVQEKTAEARDEDEIVVFSTAKTGPLPVLPTLPKQRPARSRSQFAVLGMAATILMLFMIGGLSSLLMLARNNPTSIGSAGSSVNQPSEVFLKNYAVQTAYANVVSALPTEKQIYYTAYSADLSDWMLMQFDRSSQTATPLLAEPSNAPLLLLSASQNWLVWLEYDRPQPIPHGFWTEKHIHSYPTRDWSLHYLSLAPQFPTTAQTQTNGSTTTSTSQQQPSPAQANVPAVFTLAQGTFDSSIAPAWVTTPITGVWLDDDTLLVTQVDTQGNSSLVSYQLNPSETSLPGQVIATATGGHILSWPTANYTGTLLYWADEWMTSDGTLHSNIWQQRTFDQPMRQHGQVMENTVSVQQPFLTDGLSFQPQVVDHTLFFLSTSEVTVSNDGAAAPNGIPLPASATDASVAFTPRTDPNTYAAPADAAIHGTLFSIPQDGLNVDAEGMLDTVGQVTGYQAGSGFVLWRNSSGYQMYDVQHQASVVVGKTLDNAQMLSVNSNTTLWWNSDSASATGGELSMTAFNWPN